MKKLIVIIIALFITSASFSQEKLFLVFEFMKVDNEQESAYWETESFWEKIHAQRTKNGDIIGWDLWMLKPGGESQGFQYLTVTLYNDPVKMFEGSGDLMAAAKQAYPDMSEEDIDTFLKRQIEIRGGDLESLAGYRDMMVGFTAQMDDAAQLQWAKLQTYIALGQLMTSSAVLGIGGRQGLGKPRRMETGFLWLQDMLLQRRLPMKKDEGT